MTLNHDGSKLTVQPEGCYGDHNLTLTIEEDGTECEFTLRPDSAIALASVLDVWARDRMREDGLF